MAGKFVPSMIYVGTSGYSYKDWVGPFYPEGTKQRTMLEFYAQRFPCVEINATYYSVFSDKTFAGMAQRTPKKFRFSIKAPGTATHLPTDSRMRLHADVRFFRENIEPLREQKKLSAVLMQFPNSFRPTQRTIDYLRKLRDAWNDLCLVAEFRNREWQNDETLQLLNELRISWCNVDQPQFKGLLHPSSDVTDGRGYVRFHGRNYKKWWTGDNTTRYDYLYSPQELQPWADRLIDVDAEVKETLAFFNNHRRAQAADNAEMLTEMLRTRFGKAAEKIVASSGKKHRSA
jgi:uncharacterized protein YecE (DUF72 family)